MEKRVHSHTDSAWGGWGGGGIPWGGGGGRRTENRDHVYVYNIYLRMFGYVWVVLGSPPARLPSPSLALVKALSFELGPVPDI